MNNLKKICIWWATLLASQINTWKPALANWAEEVMNNTKCISTHLLSEQGNINEKYLDSLSNATQGFPIAYNIFKQITTSNNLPISNVCIAQFMVSMNRRLNGYYLPNREKEAVIQNIFSGLSKMKVNELITMLSSYNEIQRYIYSHLDK